MRNLDFCHKFFSSSRHLGGPSLSSGRENVMCLCLFLSWRCLFSAFGPCGLAQTLRGSALLFSLFCPSSFEIRRSPRTSIHHSTSVLCVWTASTCLRPNALVRAPVRASRIVALGGTTRISAEIARGRVLLRVPKHCPCSHPTCGCTGGRVYG